MADILIKNMEMPKDCISCPFFDGSWCKAQPIDNWRTSNYRPSKGERQVTCPLVALPEHGDLKDANAILRWLNSKADNRVPVTIGEIIDFIEKQPTIVEATNE